LDVISSGDEMISPSNFKIEPLPHQLLVLDFVLNQFKPRCLLADEVGLGKTIEAALIMEELKLRNMIKRILIITPAGLTTQWKDELKIKFSEDFIVFNGATFKSFKEIYGKETNIWLKYDNVITSMDFLKQNGWENTLSNTHD
jgi:SNF2 family DNA or RNA helicase